MKGQPRLINQIYQDDQYLKHYEKLLHIKYKKNAQELNNSKINKTRGHSSLPNIKNSSSFSYEKKFQISNENKKTAQRLLNISSGKQGNLNYRKMFFNDSYMEQLEKKRKKKQGNKANKPQNSMLYKSNDNVVLQNQKMGQNLLNIDSSYGNLPKIQIKTSQNSLQNSQYYSNNQDFYNKLKEEKWDDLSLNTYRVNTPSSRPFTLVSHGLNSTFQKNSQISSLQREKEKEKQQQKEKEIRQQLQKQLDLQSDPAFYDIDLEDEQMMDMDIKFKIEFKSIQFLAVMPNDSDKEQYFCDIKLLNRDTYETPACSFSEFNNSNIKDSFKIQELLSNSILKIKLMQLKKKENFSKNKNSNVKNNSNSNSNNNNLKRGEDVKAFMGSIEIDLKKYFEETQELELEFPIRCQQYKQTYMNMDSRLKGVVYIKLNVYSNFKNYLLKKNK